MINAMSTPQSRIARPIAHSATLPFKSGAARVISLVAFSCVLLLVSTAFFIYRDFGNQLASNSINTQGLGNANSTETAAPSDSFEGRPVNILISGIDSRQNQGDDANGDAAELSSIHSDTTMLMHISADRTRVQVVSIPRDLITDIPACKRSDGTVSSAYTGMFNSAFSTGSNDTDIAGGIACTEATTEQLTGVNIDGFVVVDFHGFRGLIDALGGVWFDIPEDIDDSRSDLHVQAGCQKLDGKTALAYARTRYAVGDGSDLGRISNQQKLVAAIMRELLAKNFVSDLPSLLSFTKQGLSALQPSQNLSNINTDVGLLLSLSSIDRANIQFITSPNQYSPVDPNRVINLEPQFSQAWEAIRKDQPFPAAIEFTNGSGQEGQTNTSPSASASPSQGSSASASATPSTSPSASASASASPTAACPAER